MSSTSSLKIFVYILDLLCTLLALVLISFGIYIIVSYDTNDVGTMSAYAYIAIGTAAVFIFFWGYLAAWREHVCCTVTFIICLYIIILLQMILAFFLTKGMQSIASNLSNSLDDTWEEELNSPGAMSIYENWFDCCGRASPQDYIVNERLPPASCFYNHDNSKPENLISTGCRVAFENYWLKLLRIFNGLALALILLELTLSFLSCSLCNSIRNDRRRSYF